eukprot:5799677-Amphidinium_carterae.1
MTARTNNNKKHVGIHCGWYNDDPFLGVMVVLGYTVVGTNKPWSIDTALALSLLLFLAVEWPMV